VPPKRPLFFFDKDGKETQPPPMPTPPAERVRRL
jgi:hypothetical protein